MKNLHLLKTDKPSVLGRFIDTNNLFLRVSNDIPRGENVNRVEKTIQILKINYGKRIKTK